MATDIEILKLLKTAFATTPGVTEIQVDGLKVKVDWAMIEKYERKVNEAAGRNPFIASMNLTGFE